MTRDTTADNRSAEQAIDLRNPAIAAVLAWLLPGAGHFYQRRYFKAAVFGLSVWTLLVAGLAMGSYRAPSPAGDGSESLFFARTVYCSWRLGDRRLAFIPQSCVGVMAIPSLMQARTPRDADGSFWSAAFAPPRVPSEASTRPNQPTGNDVAAYLHSWLDLSVLYTITAGLLNLLAIFDALAGPTIVREVCEEEEKKRKTPQGKTSDSAR